MYQDLQPPLSRQSHPVQHGHPRPATADTQSREGNIKQPAKACKSGKMLAFFDSHLKILLAQHVPILTYSP